MKFINSVQEIEQSAKVATFSRLLGTEFTLSNYTALCCKKAKHSGLEDFCEVLTAQCGALSGVYNTIAGFALLQMQNANDEMQGFVNGTKSLRNEDDFFSQANVVIALMEAHIMVIDMVKYEVQPPEYRENYESISHFLKSLVETHEQMAMVLESYVESGLVF